MKESFDIDEQVTNTPILSTKTYESGRLIKEDDKPLWGALITYKDKYMTHYKVILYHKDEIGVVYEIVPSNRIDGFHKGLPKLRKIKKQALFV